MKWGISHSCFINEPFGYSIFQALDYGKIPIISKDWCEEYDYPYRANNKIEFIDLAGGADRLPCRMEFRSHWNVAVAGFEHINRDKV